MCVCVCVCVCLCVFRYMAVETEINAITAVHNIGALSLETSPLKTALKSEAASWKAQFALNLHKQGSEDLKTFDSYIRDTTLKLNRKIEDLEDVRGIMAVLKEVRAVCVCVCMCACLFVTVRLGLFPVRGCTVAVPGCQLVIALRCTL